MRWQSDNRSTLDVFEERNGMIKFYPLLDVTQDERENFIKDHHLPFHPLISKGYFSIGCKHCTVPGKVEKAVGITVLRRSVVFIYSGLCL